MCTLAFQTVESCFKLHIVLFRTMYVFSLSEPLALWSFVKTAGYGLNWAGSSEKVSYASAQSDQYLCCSLLR